MEKVQYPWYWRKSSTPEWKGTRLYKAFIQLATAWYSLIQGYWAFLYCLLLPPTVMSPDTVQQSIPVSSSTVHTSIYQYVQVHTGMYQNMQVHTNTFIAVPVEQIHTRTYQYILVYTSTHQYIPVHTSTSQYIPVLIRIPKRCKWSLNH